MCWAARIKSMYGKHYHVFTHQGISQLFRIEVWSGKTEFSVGLWDRYESMFSTRFASLYLGCMSCYMFAKLRLRSPNMDGWN